MKISLLLKSTHIHSYLFSVALCFVVSAGCLTPRLEIGYAHCGSPSRSPVKKKEREKNNMCLVIFNSAAKAKLHSTELKFSKGKMCSAIAQSSSQPLLRSKPEWKIGYTSIVGLRLAGDHNCLLFEVEVKCSRRGAWMSDTAWPAGKVRMFTLDCVWLRKRERRPEWLKSKHVHSPPGLLLY